MRLANEMDVRSREGEGAAGAFPPVARAATSPMKRARSLVRGLPVLLTAVLLAACFLPLGPNQAYLTITNPNDPTKGTFNYININLDGVLILYTITAGASQQLAVTYNQSHLLTYTFYAKPAGMATATVTQVGPTLIYVPQGGSVVLGAKY